MKLYLAVDELAQAQAKAFNELNRAQVVREGRVDLQLSQMQHQLGAMDAKLDELLARKPPSAPSSEDGSPRVAASSEPTSTAEQRHTSTSADPGDTDINFTMMNRVVMQMNASKARFEVGSEDNRSITARFERLFKKLGCTSESIPIIHPQSHLRFQWARFQLIVMLTALVFNPLQIGFPEWFEESAGAWVAFETVLDAAVALNVPATFFAAIQVEDGDELETHPARIAANYVSGSFAVDCISCFPIALVLHTSGNDNGWSRLGLRCLKLLWLRKLGKLAREVRTSKLRGRGFHMDSNTTLVLQ